MSTIAINIQSLANVRAALSKSFTWREDSDSTPLCLFDAFMPTFVSRFNAKRVHVSRAAWKFVQAAYIFNSEAYNCGKFAKQNAEPVEYNSALKALKFTKGMQLSKVQLLKTLQFIKYNTQAKGWLTDEEFNQWARRDEYLYFHKRLNAIILALLEDVVSKTKEYQEAQWG